MLHCPSLALGDAKLHSEGVLAATQAESAHSITVAEYKSDTHLQSAVNKVKVKH